MTASTSPVARRRIPRRWLWRLLALLAVIVLVLAADRVVRRSVEQRIAQAVQQQLGLSARVSVQDPLCLASLATDRWQRVVLDVPEARRTLADVPVQGSVSATARRVSGLARGPQVRVGSLEATATTSWAWFSEASGVQMSAGDDGFVRATTTIDVLDEDLPVVLRGRPYVSEDGSRLRFADASATLDSIPVPGDVVDGLLNRTAEQTTLPAVRGIRVTSVEAATDGPRLTARGEDLVLPR